MIQEITHTARKLSLDEAYRLAEGHQAAGRLQPAEALLRQILAIQPRHAFALHLLGIIAHQAGKTALAIELIGQAIDSLPVVPLFHANRGEMCRLLKRLDEAAAHGEKAVALDPRSATAHSNLGVAYYDRGEYDKAAACQQRALVIDPRLPSALNNLGSIRRERRDKVGAIAYYRKVVETSPDYLESINNLGGVLVEADQPEEALRFLLPLINRVPQYADAHCNIGNAFFLLEQYDKALAGFNQALALRPAYPEAYQGLARVWQELRDYRQAEQAASKAVELAPNRAEAHAVLAGIYNETGHPEKAEAAYARALELKPDLVMALLGKGHLLMEQGKLKEAEEIFRHALAIDPQSLEARFALTMVAKVEAGDGNMAALAAQAENLGGLPETKVLTLHFSLGKCYDDTRQYDRAFAHYLEGCRLKRKRIRYDADETERLFDDIRHFFSPESIARLRGEACQSRLPIFVLGMPRSGTTLTEQIIASHPLVHGAGELPDLLDLANSVTENAPRGYPASLEELGQADLKRLGERYVAGVQAKAPGAQRLTDKMPANFKCLGLIHLMLPYARIIHVKRDPVDTCLSGFTRLFNNSQFHSYDLAEIGRYYRNYADLMEHWRQVLPPGAFHEVQYEELVADTENQARALIEFCGLEWDDACLEFHKTRRQVRTASVTQVRQPIYGSSVQRWRKYEAHLGPLLEALGDLVGQPG